MAKQIVLQYCKIENGGLSESQADRPKEKAMYDAKKLSLEILALQEISQAIVHQKNVEALLDQVTGILDSKLSFRHGTFTLLRGDVYKIASSRDITPSGRARASYHLGEGITGHVAETGRPHVVPDISRDSRFLNLTGKKWGQEQVAFICVPIFFLERVVGTLSVDRVVSSDIDLEQDLKFLEIVGNITAEAVGVMLTERREKETLLAENRRLRDMLADPSGGMMGRGQALRPVYELVSQVAGSEATVLIRGSSGTGKELVARAIHEMSPRRDKPFVAFNCAALPEALVESELFGYERGAFTGANQRRIGRAETADGGTMFLDEIGDLSLNSQVKLLRFLQERTFSRLGSSKELKADIRFLAATSRDLEDLIRQGRFREDLYYRLNIFPIVLPDLQDRKGDISILAEHFIEKFGLKYGKDIKRISTPALNILISHNWPGNVRELENCLERAVLTTQGDCVHSHNLPPSLKPDRHLEVEARLEYGGDLSARLDAYERELLVKALEKYSGNMSAAARELGISPRVMHYKVRRLELPRFLAAGECGARPGKPGRRAASKLSDKA